MKGDRYGSDALHELRQAFAHATGVWYDEGFDSPGLKAEFTAVQKVDAALEAFKKQLFEEAFREG